MPRRRTLPRDFPFTPIFNRFLARYLSLDSSLWYLPKYTLNEENIAGVKTTLGMLILEFEGRSWDRELQDIIRQRLIDDGVFQPYTSGRGLQDRTAIVRVGIRKFFEYLGLAWIPRGAFHVTDVGLEVATSANVRPTLERQIAKFQYPNPITGEFGPASTGILPHLFLLQCIEACQGFVTTEEFNLFVNLASKQDDLDDVVTLISSWRNLSPMQQKQLKAQVTDSQRYRQISGLASYQRAFFGYPSYLSYDAEGFRVADTDAVKRAIQGQTRALKIATYKNDADWFAYYGDPKKSPSWFEFISASVEQASSSEKAKKIVKDALQDPVAKQVLTKAQVAEIKRKELEKDIETFYVKYLERIEPGLKLADNGRQYITEIGRMDLLCQDASGQYVVVEVKAGEAEDGVFGQMLRYIGWVHTNLKGGRNNVRGIILAGQFSEKARYSRMGLLKDNATTFIKFKEHGFTLSDS